MTSELLVSIFSSVITLLALALSAVLWQQMKNYRNDIRDLYSKVDKLKDYVYQEIGNVKTNYVSQFKQVREDINSLKIEMKEDFAEIKNKIK